MECGSDNEGPLVLVDLELAAKLGRKAEFRFWLTKVRIRLDLIVISGKSIIQYLVELEIDQFKIIEYLDLLLEEFDERYSTDKSIYIQKAIDLEIDNSTALTTAVELKKTVSDI